MSQTTRFISDLHLSEKNAHLNELFDVFISNILQNNTVDAVYILGDFFDVWVGDDAMGPWEYSIAEKLATLAKRGIRVYVMVGNRDFLMQDTFLSAAHATLLPDPTIINLYNKRVILKHGDDLCLGDRSYQWFRWFVRSTVIQHLYFSMPLNYRKAIAASLRKRSSHRGMRANYARISSAQVQTLLTKYSADWLIHGHTHCPQIEAIHIADKRGKHIILSDWNQKGNQLVVDAENAVYLDYFS